MRVSRYLWSSLRICKGANAQKGCDGGADLTSSPAQNKDNCDKQVNLSGSKQEKIACFQVEEARQGELAALAVRKYLDALCVYFWAATSLLTSILTFSLFVLLGHALTAEVVFTSLALFGVLIAPLNSFPWVINGCVEAVVSVRRLERYVHTCPPYSFNCQTLSSVHMTKNGALNGDIFLHVRPCVGPLYACHSRELGIVI